MPKPPLPLVYDYQDHRRYLRDWYAARKARDPRFSHAVFARKTGFASKAHFPNVVSGALNLKGEAVERFAQGLGLSGDEREYFQLLVAASQAPDRSEREARRGNLRFWLIQRKAHSFTPEEATRFLADWTRMAVFTLTRMRGFRPEAGWISRTLAPWITRKEADRALRFLKSSGMIRTRGNRLTGTTSGRSFNFAGFPYRKTSLMRWTGELYRAARDPARLRPQPPGYWIQAILNDKEARRVSREVAQGAFKAMPHRKGTRVKGRLYVLCGELFPISRRCR